MIKGRNKGKVHYIQLAIEQLILLNGTYTDEDIYWSLYGLEFNGYYIKELSEIQYLITKFIKNGRI